MTFCPAQCALSCCHPPSYARCCPVLAHEQRFSEGSNDGGMAETRGVSDSSAALVASSINGGGCLPPPTPSEKIAETLGKHMMKAVHPEETNYRDALPTSLAWRTTTQTMMVGGLAGEVTEEELAKIPLDLTSGPPCQECLPAPAGPVERARPVPKGRGARMSCSLA